MISSYSSEAKRLVEVFREAVDKSLVPYADTQIQAPQLMLIRRNIMSSIAAAYNGENPIKDDAAHWCRLRGHPSIPGKLVLELNHEAMFEARDNVPDWVYALYWACNKQYAPKFK